MSAPTRESVLEEMGWYCRCNDQCDCVVDGAKHMADEIVRLRTEYADKALAFDLDQAGVESRERDAVELVELRAELQRLHTLADDNAAVWRAVSAMRSESDVYNQHDYKCARAALRAALGGAP